MQCALISMRSVGVSVDYPTYRSETTWYRLIPSRFPPVDVYARLESVDRVKAAQAVEEQTNPRLVAQQRATQGQESGRTAEGRFQNWNHAPFVYRNPEGSYFLNRSYGVMEVVGDKRSALGFYLRRREVFLRRTEEPPMGLDMRMLHTDIRGEFINLTSLTSSMSREERWRIGQQLYDNNAQGVVFQRAGFPGAMFLSVFDRSTLKPSVQGTHYRFTWDGECIHTVYDFNSGEVIRREELLPEEPSDDSVCGGLIYSALAKGTMPLSSTHAGADISALQ